MKKKNKKTRFFRLQNRAAQVLRRRLGKTRKLFESTFRGRLCSSGDRESSSGRNEILISIRTRRRNPRSARRGGATCKPSSESRHVRTRRRRVLTDLSARVCFFLTDRSASDRPVRVARGRDAGETGRARGRRDRAHVREPEAVDLGERDRGHGGLPSSRRAPVRDRQPRLRADRDRVPGAVRHRAVRVDVPRPGARGGDGVVPADGGRIPEAPGVRRSDRGTAGRSRRRRTPRAAENELIVGRPPPSGATGTATRFFPSRTRVLNGFVGSVF